MLQEVSAAPSSPSGPDGGAAVNMKIQSLLNRRLALTASVENLLIFLFALAIVVFGIYLACKDWGSLPGTFFSKASGFLIIFGFILIAFCILHFYGLSHQTTKSGGLSGRRLLMIYQIQLAFVVALQMFALSWTLGNRGGLNHVREKLLEGETSVVNYTSFEQTFGESMNTFYFAAQTCDSRSSYRWFWSWMDDNCPEYLSQSRCEHCSSTAAEACVVDQAACISGDINVCPYSFCRLGSIDYCVKILDNFTVFVIFALVLYGFLLCINGALVCFSQRDSFVDILRKAGTLKYNVKKRPRKDAGKPKDGSTLNSAVIPVIV